MHKMDRMHVPRELALGLPETVLVLMIGRGVEYCKKWWNPNRSKFCPRTKPCGRGNSWDAFNPICNPPRKTLQYICKYIQTCTYYIPKAWLCTLVLLSDQGMRQLPLGHFCNRPCSSLESVLTQLCSILWPFVKKNYHPKQQFSR